MYNLTFFPPPFLSVLCLFLFSKFSVYPVSQILCTIVFITVTTTTGCVCVCVSKFPYRTTKGECGFAVSHSKPSSFPSRFLHFILRSPAANCPLFPPPGNTHIHTHTQTKLDTLHKQAHKILFMHMNILLKTHKSK